MIIKKIIYIDFQSLVAFVTIAKDSSTCVSKIETFLQSMLPIYMLPRVIIVENIPLLTNGKTDRQALLKYYESSNVNNGNTLVILNLISHNCNNYKKKYL